MDIYRTYVHTDLLLNPRTPAVRAVLGAIKQEVSSFMTAQTETIRTTPSYKHSRNYYRRRRFILHWTANILTIVVLIIMLFPFVWLILTTFKQPVEFLTWPPVFLPSHPTLANYQAVMKVQFIGRYFLNIHLPTYARKGR